jgi:hypothetical protein
MGILFFCKIIRFGNLININKTIVEKKNKKKDKKHMKLGFVFHLPIIIYKFKKRIKVHVDLL